MASYNIGYQLGYMGGIAIVFVLSGLWLQSKGRSLWNLLYIPFLGFIAFIIYACMKDKRKQEKILAREALLKRKEVI